LKLRAVNDGVYAGMHCSVRKWRVEFGGQRPYVPGTIRALRSAIKLLRNRDRLMVREFGDRDAPRCLGSCVDATAIHGLRRGARLDRS
jgi:hypothetical protein